MKHPILKPLIAALLLACTAQGQTIWTQRTEGVGLRLEYLSPTFPSNYPGYEFTSQILTFGARVPVGKVLSFLVEAPMAWETQNNPFASSTKNGFGNIFVGVEAGALGSPFYIDLGARPFLKQDVTVSGFGGYFGDFDRGEAYFAELTSYQLGLNIASTERRGFVYRLRVGPTMWVPEGGNESTTLIDYGGKAGYDNGVISAYTGITGRLNTKQNIGKTTFHHLGFDLGYRVYGVRPAFFYRVPLDKELSDIMSKTIGVNVTVELQKRNSDE